MLWWRQSQRDFENAKKNMELKEYYLCAFLVQQAVEKGLKSYYIIKKEEYPDKTHSLIYLGKELKVPEDKLSNLRQINPDFIYTRYPDMDGVTPYEAYDEKIAISRIEMGEDILKWLEEMIK